MIVKFFDHRDEFEPGRPRMLAQWMEQGTMPPERDDYVHVLGRTGDTETWIVRHRVWQRGGYILHVYCAKSEFDMR